MYIVQIQGGNTIIVHMRVLSDAMAQALCAERHSKFPPSAYLTVVVVTRKLSKSSQGILYNYTHAGTNRSIAVV